MKHEDTIHRYIVTEEESGIRIDRFLSSVLPGFSRSYIQKLIKEGKAFVHNKNVKSSYVLNEDDQIELQIPPLREWIPEPEQILLDIMYEDQHIIVINKPVGMVVHPGAGNLSGTLVNALLYHCGELSAIGGTLRPGIVHRLDKGTSGLLVAAKTDVAHLNLASQLARREMKRIYIALIYGEMQDQKGSVDLPIGRDPHHRERMAVNHKYGKPAITHYEVVKRGSYVTLIRVNLETGRTHQIRVHMQHLGYPIVGDPDYGRRKMSIPSGLNQNELFLFRIMKKVKYPLLHAERLELLHPISCEKMAFEASPPSEFQEILDHL